MGGSNSGTYASDGSPGRPRRPTSEGVSVALPAAAKRGREARAERERRGRPRLEGWEAGSWGGEAGSGVVHFGRSPAAGIGELGG